jgi:two-component system, NtrC family, sensor histidine kinase KinB
MPEPAHIGRGANMKSTATIDEDDRTAAILKSLDVATILIDIDAVVTHLNEQAALILGIDREESLGRSFFGLEDNNSHYVSVRDALRRALAYPEGEQQAEVSLHVRGRDHTYLLKPAPLRLDDGTPFGTMVTLHDLTYLRDKERARTNLIATLSNELKTPLTSLSLAIELLQRETPDPKQHEIIDTAVEDLARIRDLSDSLLNVTRAETTSIAVRNVTFDFARLVTSVTRKFSLQAAQKEVALRIHVGTGLECYGDPMKLSWVLSTLVGNALRSTPEGGSVEVSADRSGQALRLFVSDSGPGIPLEINDLVFEQHSQWTRDGFEGSPAALGFAIAKEIVESHRGRIFLDSSAQGSTFVVQLPHSRCI